MYRKVVIAAALVLMLCGAPALASCCGTPIVNSIFPDNPRGCAELPRIPHTFGGTLVLNNGEMSPDGAVIYISGTGVESNGIQVNPDGTFGMGTFDPKLTATGISVPGGMINVREGELLYFTVCIDGEEERARVCQGSTCLIYAPYHSGHHTTVTLYANIPVPCCG